MKILIACEFSGIVRDAFIARGHDAVSCDLMPTERPGPHIEGDVLTILDDRSWDMMIAHPPCTRLCNSGVRWLHERNLWADMRVGAVFFRRFLETGIPRVAVENPVMHSYAKKIIGRGPDFTCQPWEFGDPYKKRTCFWTQGLVPLQPVAGCTPIGATEYSANLSPTPDRGKLRSVTYPGMAREMAIQWGCDEFARL